MSRKRRKKLSFWDRIIICLFIVLLTLIGFITYAMVKDNITPDINKVQAVDKPISSQNSDLQGETETNPKDPSENKVNVLLMGIDPLAIHSDVMMVASFDTETKDISLISIPRDTKVKMTSNITSTLQKEGRTVPERNGYGVCKLNEVYAYAGKNHNNEFEVEMIEDLLGIDVDYYVTVNTEGFRDVVDAIGGVDFEVQDRLYYEITDENIVIDLYPGMQHLNGEKAEQLVRFRTGYAAQDLKRVEVQRDFLKAMLEKVTSTETIIKNAPSLIKTTINYVTTDIGITDALKYVKYINEISMENFYSETIPGEGGTYFTVDNDALEKLVKRVFYSDDPSGKKAEEAAAAEAEKETASNSTQSAKFEGSIEVSNGGTINGLAGKKAEILKNSGYNVTEITTYSGTQKNQTRIIVSDQKYGKDLLEFFPGANIEVNDKLLSVGIDMKIILGLDEK